MPGNSEIKAGYGSLQSSMMCSAFSSTTLFHSNNTPLRSAKANSPALTAASAYHSTFLMIESGIGMGVKFRRLIFLPVTKLRNLCVPWRFPVGPRLIPGFALEIILLGLSGSSCVSQYAPKGALQCFLKSSLCQITISLGDRVGDIPDFIGNPFSQSTT